MIFASLSRDGSLFSPSVLHLPLFYLSWVGEAQPEAARWLVHMESVDQMGQEYFSSTVDKDVISFHFVETLGSILAAARI